MHYGILKKLLESNPEFTTIMNSKQYRHSKTLIRTKHELGLNQTQMARLLVMSSADYLDLEFASLQTSPSTYEAVFVRLSQMTEADILAAQTIAQEE